MPEARLSKSEFVALMAMLIAITAFSIDAMLPALPEIADELSPAAPNLAQLILTSFVLGLGVGTFVTGPLSDAYGRKPVLLAGIGLYCVGSVLAWGADSLELMLAARVLQGLGVAGPRVVSVAIVRDIYEGRTMAQVVSLMMMIFALAPALAPSIGAGVIALFGWREIFLVFVLFGLSAGTWLMVRQPETLPPPARRALRAPVLWAGLREILSNGMVLRVIAALSFIFGSLFGLLSSIQPIFDETFGQGAVFHFWFMLIAVISAGGSLLNSRIVVRFGMRPVALATLALTAGATLLMVLFALVAPVSGPLALGIFVAWAAIIFFSVGLTIGNLNALAMVPLGHLAGLGASVISSIPTVLAVLVAVPMGLAFDGTPLPVALGVLICLAAAAVVTRTLKDAPVAHVKEAKT